MSRSDREVLEAHWGLATARDCMLNCGRNSSSSYQAMAQEGWEAEDPVMHILFFQINKRIGLK